MEVIRRAIRQVPDFPKKGIRFYDITTILQDRSAYRATIDAFQSRYAAARKPDAIVAMEARGFLFAAPQDLFHFIRIIQREGSHLSGLPVIGVFGVLSLLRVEDARVHGAALASR